MTGGHGPRAGGEAAGGTARAGWKLRKAGEGEVGPLAAMFAQLWPEHEPGEFDLLARERTAPSAAAPTFVAIDNESGDAVGFVYLDLRSRAEGCASSPVPFIEGWWVAPRWRGRGVGRSLVEEACAWASARGFCEIASDTEAANRASQAAHVALGFASLEPIVPMRRALAPPAAPHHQRFADRVDDYAAARPGYPADLFRLLAERVPPAPDVIAVDVGAGTGIATGPLLQAGYRVVAIEPNATMKTVADDNYGSHPAYTSHLASAERIPLPDASVALLFAAQAYHWFDPEACRLEWRRLLRPDGVVALVWNELDLAVPAMRELDEIVLRHATDDWHTRRREAARTCRGSLWRGSSADHHRFAHAQQLDFPALIRRAASASYLPRPGHGGFGSLERDLRSWFDLHAAPSSTPDAFPAASVVLQLQTDCYLGGRP